ncbi:MAG: hypothetical protein ACI8UD_002534 [Planctomycetota bacterium]
MTSSGDHVDRDYADLDARGLLKASVDMDIYAAGSASGVVISRMTLMNISSGPLTVDACGYTDVDVAGTSGNDVCFGTADRHYVTDPSGVQIDLWIDPLAIIGVNAGFTDANGEAALTFGIPPSPYLTGFSVHSQCLYVDAGAPNGFAYWTPGLRTRIGKL